MDFQTLTVWSVENLRPFATRLIEVLHKLQQRVAPEAKEILAGDFRRFRLEPTSVGNI
jgi:hypothetical protein